MIKMFINDEEVVSNKELVIKEEMLATPSAILNNCYPKTWEDIKDYTSKFYYPRDYSRCIIGQGSFEHGTNRYAKLNISGILPTFETNTEKPFDKIQIDGKSTQATSTNPVMPSPDNPSEIECVKGKNLYGNITWKVQTYAYTQLPTLNEDYTLSLKLKEGKQIPAGLYVMFTEKGIYDKTQKRIDIIANGVQNSAYIVNTKDNVKLNYISVYTPGYKDTLEEYFDIQLEKGTVATSYLPYNTIQVKDVGKNLFNILENYYAGQQVINNGITYTINGDGTVTANGTATDKSGINYYSTNYNKKLQKGTYTLSGSVGGVSSTYRIIFGDNEKEYASIDGGTTFTLSDDTYYYMTIRIYKGTTVNNLVFKPMIEKGTQATTYEPYQENITNIDLQGSELCSIGDVKDELVIKDGRAKIIKRIGKAILNGSETWRYYNSAAPYGVALTDNKDFNSNSADFKTNYFENKIWNKTTFANYNSLVSSVGDKPNELRFRYADITSLANFKTWLSTHNTTVYYQLAQEQEIDLGEVETLSTFKGVNNVSLDSNMQTNMNLTYLWENYGLLFSGIVKNSGNISLNPRYPHFASFQILDFKTFLSESDTLDFVISNKTITEAIEMVIDAISTYGFILGNIKIFGADDVIGAYSTQNKTAYDVFQYIAEITGSRWFTRLIDEKTIAIDFYDPTLMERGNNLEYNEKYFEDNYVVDLSFSYGSRDYRNKQVILSDEIYASIDYTEVILSNGYQTTFNTENNIGIIKSIYIDNIEKTFATNNEKETGIDAEFYYTPGKSSFESDGSTYPAGTQITITYTPLVRGRQVVYNNDEVARIYAQTGRKGVIARYESRNDILSSKELDKVGQSYIKYKGSPEVILTLTTEEKDLYNIGQIVYFDSPIPELAQDYMIKSKQIKIIMIDEISQKVFFIYELTSSFNAEKEINYFDNQRNKNKGNISVGETITRNIDIENTANIIFKDMTINETSATGNNLLNSVLNSPFVE